MCCMWERIKCAVCGKGLNVLYVGKDKMCCMCKRIKCAVCGKGLNFVQLERSFTMKLKETQHLRLMKVQARLYQGECIKYTHPACTHSDCTDSQCVMESFRKPWMVWKRYKPCLVNSEDQWWPVLTHSFAVFTVRQHATCIRIHMHFRVNNVQIFSNVKLM